MSSREEIADRLIDMSGWYAELALLNWLIDSCLAPILASGPVSLADLASWAGYNEDRIAPVLDGLVGLRIVELSGDGYTMSAMAERFVPGGSGYLGDAIQHHARYWRLWSDLSAMLTKRAEPTDWMLDRAIAEDGDSHTLLLRSTATETTVAERSEILRQVLAPSARTLVDLGGGPGTLAHQAVASKASLRAEVWDVPASEEVWRVAADSLPASARRRVSFRPCDLRCQSTWATPYSDVDTCLISHVLANYGLEFASRMLTNVFRVFPDSTVFVVTPWRPFGDARDPLSALLFDVLIQSATHHGAAHTNAQIEQAIFQAGGVVLNVSEVSESGLWKCSRR
jgi:hypothetical protein